MIGFLKGRLAVKQPPALMVDVNGVGYELEAPMSTFYGLPAAGEPVALYTHLVVRDDAHILFGFGSESERRLFRGLLKAVRSRSRSSRSGFCRARASMISLRIVEAEDIAMLTRIPGIGRKTAERVIIEMRDSVQKFATLRCEGGQCVRAFGAQPAERGVCRVGGPRVQTARGDAPCSKAADEPGLSTTEMIRRALKAAAKP